MIILYTDGSRMGHRRCLDGEKPRDRALKETAQRDSSRSVLLTKDCSGDKAKKNEMSSIWHVKQTELQSGFWWGILRERNHLEDLGIDGSIILN
jgi:hypothetical protein